LVRPWYWPEGGQPYRAKPFNWIVKGIMAVSWWPDMDVLRIYNKEGIKVIVNCSEFNNRNDVSNEFHYYHINIPDFGLPSESQILKYLEITEKHMANREPIVTHCVAGCGRTGQMIIAWAAKNGYIPENTDPVKWLRKLRPCSLETKAQEELARKLHRKYLKIF